MIRGAAEIGMNIMSGQADNHKLRARRSHAETRIESIKLKQEWRRVNIEYKELDKARRSLLQKRHFVDEKSRQLSLVAELAALVAAFQMIVLYEQELPSASSHRFHDVLLACWGASCLVVSGVDICVMFIGALLNFLILQKSTDEGDIHSLPIHKEQEQEQEQVNNPYSLLGDSKEGVIQDKAGAMQFWRDNCDRLFVRIVRAFSFSVPGFLLNFAALGYVKFWEQPVARWAAVAVPLVGIWGWWKCHGGLIEQLVWRAPEDSAALERAHARESAGSRDDTGDASSDGDDLSRASQLSQASSGSRD